MEPELAQALEKLKEYQRFGSILGLERIRALLKRLGKPERGLRVLHVAGTNGKGSVSRFLYEVLLANGYRTGLYTSPFLEVFNERIEADGRRISDGDAASLLRRVQGQAEAMIREGMESPTEFELITAMAFLYFREKQSEYVVLEVGLGGGGDSTNVIEAPLVSVITSVSPDHTDRLGSTLEEIAEAKAGIIKPGAPVVMNAGASEAARVIARRAYREGSVLWDVSRIPVTVADEGLMGSTLSMELWGTAYDGVRISMGGRHQAENAKTALAALEILRRQGQVMLQRKKLYYGMEKARQPGRLEVISREPLIVLDGAHNEAGAAALAESLRRYLPDCRIRMVVGILADKDAEGILRELLTISQDFIATEPDSERRMTAGALCDIIRRGGGRCRAVADPEQALEAALAEVASAAAAGSDGEKMAEAVVAAGSLYLIGRLRRGRASEQKRECLDRAEEGPPVL